MSATKFEDSVREGLVFGQEAQQQSVMSGQQILLPSANTFRK